MLGVALTVRTEVESWNFFFDLSCMGCIDSAHGDVHEMGSSCWDN